MKTSKEIEASFRAELQALLNKYNAVINAENHWKGCAEFGVDVRMTVKIGSVWDGHECKREYTEIDLGHSVEASS